MSGLPPAQGSRAQLWGCNGLPVIRAALQPPYAACRVGQMQPLPRAKGTHGVAHPPPRFHNGTLLDRRTHRYGAHLELHGLHPDQAGTYHCKAWNDAGAVRSGTARLTVLGEYPQ